MPPKFNLDKIKFATDPPTFEKLCGQSTCFDWEEPLMRIFDE